MPLNLSVSDGEFVPYIKYNAKAGRWYVKSPDGAEIEVVNPGLAFDMTNIKTGWIMFTEGMGPVSVWDKSATEMAARPEGKYKRGFNVLVCGNSVPGIGPLGLREFSSTAGAVTKCMIDMYRAYEEQVGGHPNQVPFYQCTGVTAISGMHGTNYEPHFELKGWVDRAKVPAFDEHLRTQANGQTNPVRQGREVYPAPDVNAPLTHGGDPISDFAPRSVGAEIDDAIPWE